LPRQRPLAGGIVRVASAVEIRPEVRSVHVECEFPDATWTQIFLSRPLSTSAFEQLLVGAGLWLDSYLTDDGGVGQSRRGLNPAPPPPSTRPFACRQAKEVGSVERAAVV
jgi:hypothetical protein